MLQNSIHIQKSNFIQITCIFSNQILILKKASTKNEIMNKPAKEFNICNLLEIMRFIFLGIGIFFVEYYGHEPLMQLNIISITVVLSLGGLTAIESIFFAKKAAVKSGYGESNAYQRQSGFNNLALSLVTIAVYYFDWGYFAKLTVLLVILTFLTFSAGNHLYTALAKGNKSIRNMLRPAITVILLIYTIPIIIAALKVLS